MVSERLTPEQAVRKVLAVAAEVKQLSVVGIAGPGDPLANPAATFATLEGIRRVAPDLTLCLSTNGLALPDHVERLAALGVDHVTVTVNMVDPAVGERIYPWAIWKGRKVRGLDASRLLSERQLEGIERLQARGILCKVNSVVIPGVNDQHLPEVSRRLRALGVFLHNLMPLLSAPRARHPLRADRPARPDRRRAGGRAAGLRAGRADHAPLPPVPLRRGGAARRGPQRASSRWPRCLPSRPRTPRDVRAAHRAAVERVRARQETARRARAAPAWRRWRAGLTRPGGRGHARAAAWSTSTSATPASSWSTTSTATGARLSGRGRSSGTAGAATATTTRWPPCSGRWPTARRCWWPRWATARADSSAAAGIEPVTEYAHQPIEAAVLGWFGGYADLTCHPSAISRGEPRGVMRSAPAPRTAGATRGGR